MAASLVLGFAGAVQAATYTANANGTWSTPTRWNPTSGASGPTSGDTVVPNNKTLTYDAAATGFLGSISGGQGYLTLQKSLVISGQVGFSGASSISTGSNSLTIQGTGSNKWTSTALYRGTSGTFTVNGTLHLVNCFTINFLPGDHAGKLWLANYNSNYNRSKVTLTQPSGAMIGLTVNELVQNKDSGNTLGRVTLNFDSLTGTTSGLDWGFRLLGNQVTTLKTAYGNGSLVVSSGGAVSFDPNTNIFYKAATNYTYVGWELYAKLEATPAKDSTLNFGSVLVGGSNTLEECVKLKNIGDTGPLIDLQGATFSSETALGAFTIVGGDPNVNLAKNEFQAFDIKFDAASLTRGTYTAVVTFANDSPEGNVSYNLSANVYIAELEATPVAGSTLDFGSLVGGSNTLPACVTLKNIGDVSSVIDLDGATFSLETAPGAFSIVAGDAYATLVGGATPEDGESVAFDIKFDATGLTPGTYTATVTFRNDSPEGNVSYNLTALVTGGVVIPEPAGLGLIGAALLAFSRRRR